MAITAYQLMVGGAALIGFGFLTRWKYQWIYREVICASILYGDAVGGCVQSVDDIIKV